MKLYKIKVNGKLYEVELESVTESDQKIVAPAAAAAPAAKADGVSILAPMQGTIVKTNVAAGAKVTKGAVVAVLEAMKLENEILAPITGTILSLAITKGQKVDAGQLLMIVG